MSQPKYGKIIAGLRILIVSLFSLCCLGITTRVANLFFSKLDFEILAFCNTLAFLEIKKPDKIWLFLAFFSQKGLALAKHCLSCVFITNLF